MKEQRTAVIVVQPALPAYRRDFFDRLAQQLGRNFHVHYSPVDMGVLTSGQTARSWERRLGPINNLLPGLSWQSGVMDIPISAGDIVVVSGAPRCLSNILLLLKARMKGARTVWWGHYWTATGRNWRLALRLVLMRLSHALLFYTDGEIKEYGARAPGSGRPLLGALNNGINTESIRALRVPYFAVDRPKAILFIGRISAKAHLSLILRALADHRLADVRLELIGSGLEEGALREEARMLGIEDRIGWHGGTVDEAVIAEVANRCRLFVYPGEVGLSLIHAMAYGLPAVVHNDRWKHMPEIAAFSNNVTGRTFDVGQASSLADVLSACLEDHEGLDRWSQSCIATTDASYNTANMAERFLAMVVALRSDNA